MTLTKLKILILTTLILGFLYSCKNGTELSFDYKIDGNLITTLESMGIPISKTKSNYTLNGEVTIDYSLIEKQTYFETLLKRDSSYFTRKINGKNIPTYYSITNTKLTCNSFDLLMKEGKSKSFIVSGEIESEIITVKSTLDTLNFKIKGTFVDTVYINNANIDYADKMSQFVINKDLSKYIQKEINKITSEIASR